MSLSTLGFSTSQLSNLKKSERQHQATTRRLHQGVPSKSKDSSSSRGAGEVCAGLELPDIVERKPAAFLLQHWTLDSRISCTPSPLDATNFSADSCLRATKKKLHNGRLKQDLFDKFLIYFITVTQFSLNNG